MPDLVGTAVLLALSLFPALLAGWLAHRTRRSAPPGRPHRGVWLTWLASVALLAAGPVFGSYATATNLGRLPGPAPGLLGQRVAGWLTLVGLAAFLLALLGLAAEGLRDRLSDRGRA